MNKLQVVFSKKAKLATLSALSIGATAAQAAADVSAITSAGADVAAVGAAVFAVIVGAMVFKWIRRAL